MDGLWATDRSLFTCRTAHSVVLQIPPIRLSILGQAYHLQAHLVLARRLVSTGHSVASRGAPRERNCSLITAPTQAVRGSSNTEGLVEWLLTSQVDVAAHLPPLRLSRRSKALGCPLSDVPVW